MGNMSYCRFENTNADLEDCLDAIEDELSATEHEYRIKLVRKCAKLILDWAETSTVDEAVEWAATLPTTKDT